LPSVSAVSEFLLTRQENKKQFSRKSRVNARSKLVAGNDPTMIFNQGDFLVE